MFSTFFYDLLILRQPTSYYTHISIISPFKKRKLEQEGMWPSAHVSELRILIFWLLLKYKNRIPRFRILNRKPRPIFMWNFTKHSVLLSRSRSGHTKLNLTNLDDESSAKENRTNVMKELQWQGWYPCTLHTVIGGVKFNSLLRPI